MEDVFNTLDWTARVNVNGECISHLHLTLEELGEMLNGLGLGLGGLVSA